MASTSKDNNNLNNGDTNKESQEVEALVEEAMAFARNLELCHPRGHKQLVETLEKYRNGSIRNNWDFFKNIQTVFFEREYYLFEDIFRIFFRKELRVPGLNDSSEARGPQDFEEKEKQLRDLTLFYFSGNTCATSHWVREPRTDPRALNDSTESEAEEKGSENEFDRTTSGSEDEPSDMKGSS